MQEHHRYFDRWYLIMILIFAWRWSMCHGWVGTTSKCASWLWHVCFVFSYEFSTCLCFCSSLVFGMFWFVPELCSPDLCYSLIRSSMYSLMFLYMNVKFNFSWIIKKSEPCLPPWFCCTSRFWFWPSPFSLGFMYWLSFFYLPRYRIYVGSHTYGLHGVAPCKINLRCQTMLWAYCVMCKISPWKFQISSLEFEREGNCKKFIVMYSF